MKPRFWPGQRLAIVAVAATVLIALIAGYFILSASDEGSGVPSAVIVDQLSAGGAKPPFAHTVTEQLEAAGYTVDYYPAEEVTVDFYRQLPTLGYDLILLRAHSGLIQGGEREGEAFLFTSEPYNNQEYPEELSERRLLSATYSGDGLSSNLRSIAVVDKEAPADILTKSYRSADPDAAPVGLAYSRMDGDSREQLINLIRLYINRSSDDLAGNGWSKVESAGFDGITFAWAGSAERWQGHYYAIKGSEFLIEYDNTQNGANHIHSVFRDYQNDFGEDLLAAHYEGSNHH